MALFGKDKEENQKTEVKTEKIKKPRSIPSNVISHFNDEEKALYAKEKKDLKPDDVKKLYDIKIKILKFQGRIVSKKIEAREKTDPKLLTYAKCIFAEEILSKNPDLIKSIQDKEFTVNGASGLEALAKKHGLTLKFKIKPKKEKTA
jgi:hypothetical protein